LPNQVTLFQVLSYQLMLLTQVLRLLKPWSIYFHIQLHWLQWLSHVITVPEDQEPEQCDTSNDKFSSTQRRIDKKVERDRVQPRTIMIARW